MTGVPSLRTTVTDLGPWLPVRRCSKAIAAWAFCGAMVDLDSFIALSLMVATASRHRGRKKAGMAEHHWVLDHDGLLVNEPPGPAGLPFT
jgi:hypothetical protein